MTLIKQENSILYDYVYDYVYVYDSDCQTNQFEQPDNVIGTFNLYK